jgi:transposase InsO family protein
VRTRVRSRQTNGVIERFFGTLKYEHLYRGEIPDGDVLAVEINRFRQILTSSGHTKPSANHTTPGLPQKIMSSNRDRFLTQDTRSADAGRSAERCRPPGPACVGVGPGGVLPAFSGSRTPVSPNV